MGIKNSLRKILQGQKLDWHLPAILHDALDARSSMSLESQNVGQLTIVGVVNERSSWIPAYYCNYYLYPTNGAFLEITCYCPVCKEKKTVDLISIEDTDSGRQMYIGKCDFCSTKLSRLFK